MKEKVLDNKKNGMGMMVLFILLYAVAAALGAGVVVAGHVLALPAAPAMVAGAVLCFGLRFMAIRRLESAAAAVAEEVCDDVVVVARKPAHDADRVGVA